MRLRRTTSVRLVASLLICGPIASCTAGHDGGAAPTTDPTTAPVTTAVSTATAPVISLTRPDARFRVTIRQLGDGVSPSERRGLRKAIGAPVSAWFEHAFLRLDYPTAEFPAAFGSWTHGSIGQATSDRAVTTNAALGPDLVAVVADKQRATVFVFANRGVTGGATARIRLAMTGERKNGSLVRCVVSGDLYLTRDKGRWSIFGYDLHRSVGAS